VNSLRICGFFLICISLSLSTSVYAGGLSKSNENPQAGLLGKHDRSGGVDISSLTAPPLMLRPLTAKEKQSRISFLLNNKKVFLREGGEGALVCNAILDHFTSQSYKVLKPDEQELFLQQRNAAFRPKGSCSDLDIERVYVPAASNAKHDNSGAHYAVKITRNLEGYNLSSYVDGAWLYTGEDTVVDKENTQKVSGMIGHENETLVRVIDKKTCSIKTPVDESLRMLKRYNTYIDRSNWNVFYEDTPSFSAVLDIDGVPFFLVFSSFSVGWNQFLSASDTVGAIALEQIDLLSGKFKKICNFSVK